MIDGDPTDPAVTTATGELTAALGADARYGEIVATVSDDGEIVLIEAVTKLDPSTEEGRNAAAALRAETIPATFAGVDAEVLVTGLPPAPPTTSTSSTAGRPTSSSSCLGSASCC